METKQSPLDLGLLATGIGLVFGSFSPWISVSVITVAGTDGFFGFVTLLSGLLLTLLASSKLWPNFLDKKYFECHIMSTAKKPFSKGPGRNGPPAKKVKYVSSYLFGVKFN